MELSGFHGRWTEQVWMITLGQTGVSTASGRPFRSSQTTMRTSPTQRLVPYGGPVDVRTTTGTGFGAQHSGMLEGPLVHAAGVKVVIPSNPADAKGLLLSSVFDDDPVAFVETSGLCYADKH